MHAGMHKDVQHDTACKSKGKKQSKYPEQEWKTVNHGSPTAEVAVIWLCTCCRGVRAESQEVQKAIQHNTVFV